MPPNTDCPSVELLRRSLDLDDPMTDQERHRISEHIDCCQQGCKQAIDTLLRGTTLSLAQGMTLAVNGSSVAAAAVQDEAELVVSGYEVLGELGRGGMGVVYRARQLALDRVVALKMLLRPVNEAEAEDYTRFTREALAVASLNHGSIVQIYELGRHGDRPFIAMELVEGGNLSERLAGVPQPPQEAAALVARLADAVQAAHQQQIIHRDLKPANILVAVDGTPKITDFGLAKRLDVESTESVGKFLGTASYAAPEQALGRIQEVGAATDVYGLGAILYEMLTGRPPFRAASTWETLQQVVGSEPVPPSRLTVVPRDLDTICLKCLAKEPGRRYPSAQALAEDLLLFQAGQPIRARPVGWPERLVKWVKRRPAVAALTAAVIIVVLGSIAGLTMLYLNAESQRRLAERQRRLAEHQEAGARAITKFFEDNVLAAARPIGWEGGTGYDVSLKETLDVAATKIDDAFAGQPEREAAVRNTIGMTYLYLGHFAAADPHLAKAYRLRNENLGTDHLDTLTSLHNLAMLRGKQSAFPEAIAHASQALQKRRQILGRDHPDTLWTQLVLGYAYRKNLQIDAAAAEVEPAIEACKRTLGPEHSLTLLGQFEFAGILWAQDRTAESVALKRQTLEGRRRALGPAHPDTVRSQGNLGVALMDLGQLPEAKMLCQQTFDVRKRVLGPEHQETLWSQWFLADVLSRMEQRAEAEKLLREGLEVCRRKLRPNHEDTLEYLALLGDVLCDAGRPAEAEPLLRECLLQRTLPLGHGDSWNTAAVRSLLGRCLVEQGHFAAAEPLLLGGYEELHGSKGVPARQLGRAVDRIVLMYERWGRLEQAETWRKKSSRIGP